MLTVVLSCSDEIIQLAIFFRRLSSMRAYQSGWIFGYGYFSLKKIKRKRFPKTSPHADSVNVLVSLTTATPDGKRGELLVQCWYKIICKLH